jgi:hypothetical protein|tara:strand:+ start:510 stop:620 length:111 start_codon:yes stop_codon:yes gene_type:complete
MFVLINVGAILASLIILAWLMDELDKERDEELNDNK